MNPIKDRLQKIISCIGQAGVVPAPTNVSVVVVVGATTASTRLAIPHGLNYTPNIHCIHFENIGNDDDVANALLLNVIKADGTNVTVKPSVTLGAALVNFLMYIDLDTDIGGRHFATGT